MAHEITKFDLIWEAVNALGGVPSNEAEADYCRAIHDVLDVIEKLGGSDPIGRRYAAANQNTSETMGARQ